MTEQGHPLWHDTARMLKAGDPSLTHAEIGRRLGVTQSAVWKALNPEKMREINRQQNQRRRQQKLAWEREWLRRQRAVCSSCGGPMGIGSARDMRRRQTATKPMCAGCRGAVSDARDSLIRGMWADGWTVSQIADVLGVSVTSLGVRMYRIRQRYGVDYLPYRYDEDLRAKLHAGQQRSRNLKAAA